MSEEKPLSEPNADSEGRIYADEGTAHYIVIELDDGDERLTTESNAIFMLHRLAESFSTEVPGFMDTALIVRADTHEAIFRYEKGKGLQEGWKENDPQKAAARKKAYEAGNNLIIHQR